MKKNWKKVLTAIIVLLSLTLAVTEAMADKAPDFTLRDLQGRKFKLSENKGKPVLLVFGATWCAYCVEEIPHLKEIHNNYGGKGVIVAYIDFRESRAKVARFAEKHKLPYPVLLDEAGEVARSYRVRGVPNFTLVDKDGTIACRECTAVEPLLDKMLTK